MNPGQGVVDAAAPLCSPHPLRRREFEQIRRLAREKFGLDLRDGKEQLVAARLGKKLRAQNLRSFEEYCSYVLADRTGEALVEMIDALTTNYTSFLREPAHFELLETKILPCFRGRGPINIWSAGCSSGEEPYSIACQAVEALGDEALRSVRVLATDISSRVLRIAEAGAYARDRLRAMPPHWAAKYFDRDRSEGSFRIKPEVRAMIEFRRLNLMERLPAVPRFQVIFCRNVMIYFDKETEEDLVRRLSECLVPGGFLLIGHAESFAGIHHRLEYCAPGTFRKPAQT